MPIAQGLERVRFVNQLAGLAARRTAVDDVVARLAAAALLANIRAAPTSTSASGCRRSRPGRCSRPGASTTSRFLVESGVIGGLPAPGIFFGAAVCPQRIVSSADLFALCYAGLDATCLGVLQADSAGQRQRLEARRRRRAATSARAASST